MRAWNVRNLQSNGKAETSYYVCQSQLSQLGFRSIRIRTYRLKRP